ncbi:hypothetical protein LguiA_029440 [Lonicera macranthoides]
MAGSSTKENSSNKIYRRWLAETFDGQETGEEEELTTDNLNGNKTVPPLRLAPFEPCVGMEFESAEDAREFYELYGRHLGFSIRNNRTRRSLKDNSIISREFVCSKEGFRTGSSSSSRVQKNCLLRPATRGGCSAMIRITAKDGGKWAIYGFAKEHNHELNPTKMPPRRSHRIAFCEDEKDLKIRELSTELHRERKRSASYQQQLKMILKYVEEHTHRLSLNVEVVLNQVRELENEEQDDTTDID